MKFLIWTVLIVFYAFLTAILKSCGIVLGALPSALLGAGVISLASFLCKKYNSLKKTEESEITSSEEHMNPVEVVPVEPKVKKAAFCRMCGEKLLENSKFCRHCGADVFTKNTVDNQGE